MNGVSPEIISTIVFTGLCMGMGLTILVMIRVVTHLLGTAKPAEGKYDAYECGVPLLGSARDRFDVRFYLIALLFVLFDIETVFLLPYAVSYKKLGMEGFFEITAFVAVLGLGLLYLIRRGALDWE